MVTSIAFGIMLSVSRTAVKRDESTQAIRAEIAELPSGMIAANPLAKE